MSSRGSSVSSAQRCRTDCPQAAESSSSSSSIFKITLTGPGATSDGTSTRSWCCSSTWPISSIVFIGSSPQSNSPFSPLPSALPLASALRGLSSPLPSTLSQSTSSIGGGTTRTKLVRFTASKPLPPRDVTSYLPRPNSIVLPPDVSSTNLSNRPDISAPPRHTSSLSSLMPITPLPAPARMFTSSTLKWITCPSRLAR